MTLGISRAYETGLSAHAVARNLMSGAHSRTVDRPNLRDPSDRLSWAKSLGGDLGLGAASVGDARVPA
jgi:hypothetical protein